LPDFVQVYRIPDVFLKLLPSPAQFTLEPLIFFTEIIIVYFVSPFGPFDGLPSSVLEVTSRNHNSGMGSRIKGWQVSNLAQAYAADVARSKAKDHELSSFLKKSLERRTSGGQARYLWSYRSEANEFYQKFSTVRMWRSFLIRIRMKQMKNEVIFRRK
jgi:hypothetical protein